MAKGLPFFKFECDEWLQGDITLEKFIVQGIFINICAFYWKKDNRLAIGKLYQKFDNVSEEQWKILFDSKVLKMNGKEHIRIDFLDEQRSEIDKDHKKKSDGGKKGARKRWGKNRIAITKPFKKEESWNKEERKEDVDVDQDKDRDKDLKTKDLKNARAFSILLQDEEHKEEIVKDSGEEEKENVNKILQKYLSGEQIKRAGKLVKITQEYLERKIGIMKIRKPKNEAAFLYAALTQNYKPIEMEPLPRKKPPTHRLIQKAKSSPLSVMEFEKLPEELQKKFQCVEHIMPERKVFELTSKPQPGGNAIERAIFDNLDVGETVEETRFNQLSENHKKHFESRNHPAKPIKKFHLR